MIKPVLAVALIVISMPVMAKSVDWTPYLKGMQDGCNLEDLYQNGVKKFAVDSDGDGVADGESTDYDLLDLIGVGYGSYGMDHTAIKKAKKSNMPKVLQPSVAKYTTKKIGDYGARIDIHLKNAVAFGQRITRIVYGSNHAGEVETYYTFTLYFANKDFSKIKSKFYVTINGKKHFIGEKKKWELSDWKDSDSGVDLIFTEIPFNTKSKSYSDMEAIISQNYWHIISRSDAWEGGFLEFNTKNRSISCQS